MHDSVRLIHFYETCSRNPGGLQAIIEDMERTATYTFRPLTRAEERETAELERSRVDAGLYGPEN